MFTDADDGRMCGSRVQAGLSATVAFGLGVIPPRLKVARMKGVQEGLSVGDVWLFTAFQNLSL